MTLSGTSYDIDTGTATFEAASGAGTIAITSTSAVEFITDGTDITFDTGSIELGGNSSTTIKTGTGAGNVQIDGAIDSASGKAENLTITSGTGNITVDGAMGAVVNLGTISINNGTNDGNGDIEIAAIGGSASGATGAVNIGNTATDKLTLDGQLYNTDNTQTYTAEAGSFTILLKPGDASSKTVKFTTSNDAIKFATGDVELYGDTTHTIDTGSGVGDVTFDGDIQSGDDGNDDVLVVTSGTGSVLFTGHIGNTKELGGLNVNDGTVTAGQKSGTITFSNTIGNAGAGVKSGATKIGNTNTGTVAFGSSLYSFDGDTTITSASGDNITVGATAEFETKQDAITFATGTIKLANNANLTVNSDGQVITIDSIAGTSDETVTINADVVTVGLNATNTETVRIGNVGDSSHVEIHNLTIDGEDGITLTGAIYTSGVMEMQPPTSNLTTR